MKLSETLKAASGTNHVKIPSNPITVSSGKEKDGTKQVASIDDVPLPVSLHDATQVLGEKTVYRMFMNALVVALQGEVRPGLKGAKDGSGRKKAAYLEDFGI